MGRDVSGIQVQAPRKIASGASRVLDEELDDARLAVALVAARSGAPIARASSGRPAHRASRRSCSFCAVVGGGHLLLLLGVSGPSGSGVETSAWTSTRGMCARSRPSVGPRREKRARTSSVQRDIATTSRPVHRAHAGRPHTDPAVKTGNPSLPPRGAGYCAVGGIRARAGSPGRRASHLPTVLPSPAVM